MTDLPANLHSVPGGLGATGLVDERGLVIELEPRTELLHHGVLRASVISFAVDVVAGVTLDTDPDAWTFTTDLTLRMRPVPAPGRITASGRSCGRGGGRPTACSRSSTSAAPRWPPAPSASPTSPASPRDPPKPIVVTGRRGGALLGRGPDHPAAARGGADRVDRSRRGRRRDGGAAGGVQPGRHDPGRHGRPRRRGRHRGPARRRSGTPVVVTDLDIRYLGQATVGPVRSRCHVLGDDLGAVPAGPGGADRPRHRPHHHPRLHPSGPRLSRLHSAGVHAGSRPRDSGGDPAQHPVHHAGPVPRRLAVGGRPPGGPHAEPRSAGRAAACGSPATTPRATRARPGEPASTRAPTSSTTGWWATARRSTTASTTSPAPPAGPGTSRRCGATPTRASTPPRPTGPTIRGSTPTRASSRASTPSSTCPPTTGRGGGGWRSWATSA